jgi:hypothetical protein
VLDLGNGPAADDRLPGTPVAQSGVERAHAVAVGRTGARKGSYGVVGGHGLRAGAGHHGVGSIGEAVRDGVTGIVVQADSPDQITTR